MKSRNISIVTHCYQRTVDGFLIFYTVSDFVVFFTRFCILASRYNIRVLKVCLMYDHIHISVIAPDKETLSTFVGEYSRLFAHEYNVRWGLSGKLFYSPFGRADKREAKAIRTNLIYVDNNPVERHIVKKAEDYRWNFLAYAVSNHPFSEKVILSKASTHLRDSIKTVEALHKRKVHLSYATLSNLLGGLTKEECNQLVDRIISIYNVIDYEYSLRLFGSYDNMILALHSTSGSEYDIKEVNEGKSDAFYPSMTNILLKEFNISDIHDVLTYSADEKMYLVQQLFSRTTLGPVQIGKYLHLVLRPRKDSKKKFK